jgi:hypothetical protein
VAGTPVLDDAFFNGTFRQFNGLGQVIGRSCLKVQTDAGRVREGVSFSVGSGAGRSYDNGGFFRGYDRPDTFQNPFTILIIFHPGGGGSC